LSPSDLVTSQNASDDTPNGDKRYAVRSLPFDQWPEVDRLAWAAACRPAERLRRGGAASHMRDITRRDLARRYGYFLDQVQRTKRDLKAGAAGLVTPDRVKRFVVELKERVGSVTVHGSIYKLRRMAELLVPSRNREGSRARDGAEIQGQSARLPQRHR
jgi:hypothetical protein